MPSAERYKKLVAEGRCTACGRALLPEWDRLRHPECDEKIAKAGRRWFKRKYRKQLGKNPLAIRLKWRAKNAAFVARARERKVCIGCGDPSETLRCPTCRQDHTDQARERYQRERAA